MLNIVVIIGENLVLHSSKSTDAGTYSPMKPLDTE